MSLHRWLHRREHGLPSIQGDFDRIMHRVYTSIEDYKYWNYLPSQTFNYEGISELEFSPKGNVLVAACEKSIILFDTINQRQIDKIKEAHTFNVNCIKFVDERMFATCSDDTTVALWDLRYLKVKVRSLHINAYCDNIEYSNKDNLLVTSAPDGSIFTWDLNSPTEQKVFHTSGLLCCCITPDCTKLVISSVGGYLIIIHDLDLTTLHKDLKGFQPNVYRSMQMGSQYIPQAARFDHVFSKKQKKNRIELVTDFPEENDAELVLALQIHPQGRSILSRNESYDEKSEWTCIHDINEEPSDITERLNEEHISSRRKRTLQCESDDESCNVLVEGGGNSHDVLFSINRRRRTVNTRLSLSLRRCIFQNPKKLMYYIEEPNRGLTYIKEPSFSRDGRIVCSPYEYGVRLLAYSEICSEYPRHFQEVNGIKQNPRTLKVLKELITHDDIILHSKFSPREPLLVTGCRSGKIVWYYPIL